jgi:hypothetical protein
MKRELRLNRQTVRFDRSATVALYRRKITAPSADQCACISCKNFAAQRSTVYPEAFLQILRKLGVNPLVEWQAFDYDFGLERQEHIYGGWFLFCGELIGTLEDRPAAEDQPFSFWFTTKFLADTLPLNAGLCAVEFLAPVPWILRKRLRRA